MSYSGEAADQVVRMSLNGVEVAAKLSGAAAKQRLYIVGLGPLILRLLPEVCS